MIKKIVTITAATLFCGLLLPATAHASRYTMADHITFHTGAMYYHNKNQQSHAIWNWSHSRKLHNLKNYPHTTWVVKQTALFIHGTHKARYYYVVSKNKRTSGWVWHGFLQSGTYRRQQLTTDGLTLSSQLTNDDAQALKNFMITKLQKDGYDYNNHLAMMYDYYWSNHLTPKQLSYAAVIKLVRIKDLDPTTISDASQDNVLHLAKLIDPKHGDTTLETIGKGQLGVQLVQTVEQALDAHHAKTYLLDVKLSGNLTAGTPHLQYTLYMS